MTKIDYLQSVKNTAQALGLAIEQTIPQEKPIFISLGQNCLVSWYLKSLGLKTNSYPFDWIFSSPHIISDCIEDDFRSFLDKGYYSNRFFSNFNGHNKYHKKLFNHKRPYSSTSDYDYYQRCVLRFGSAFLSSRPICFVVNDILDHEKRINWSTNFIGEYAISKDKFDLSFNRLVKLIRSRKSNVFFLVLKTGEVGNGFFRIVGQEVPGIVTVSCETRSENNGVYFLDPLDDFCMKYLFSSLTGW